MFFPLKLAGRVDRAAQGYEDDTLQTKATLKALGHYKTPTYGMTPYPDEPMFEGIKAYQKANKLKIDGVMKPGGETEQSMNKQIAGAQAAARDRIGATRRRKERRDALEQEQRKRSSSDDDSPFLDTLERAAREKLESDAKKKGIDGLTGARKRKNHIDKMNQPKTPSRPIRGGGGGGGFKPWNRRGLGRGNYDPYEILD